jgi:hypothetical protein
MSKTIFADSRLEAYQSFFDHPWAKEIMALAHGTKLDQPVFDLCAAWRGAANTHLLPWLLATQVQNATGRAPFLVPGVMRVRLEKQVKG